MAELSSQLRYVPAVAAAAHVMRDLAYECDDEPNPLAPSKGGTDSALHLFSYEQWMVAETIANSVALPQLTAPKATLDAMAEATAF